MNTNRWNLFAAFMAGVVIATGITAFSLNAYLQATEVKPRQDKIDELYRKNIELEADVHKWRSDALAATVR